MFNRTERTLLFILIIITLRCHYSILGLFSKVESGARRGNSLSSFQTLLLGNSIPSTGAWWVCESDASSRKYMFCITTCAVDTMENHSSQWYWAWFDIINNANQINVYLSRLPNTTGIVCGQSMLVCLWFSISVFGLVWFSIRVSCQSLSLIENHI